MNWEDLPLPPNWETRFDKHTHRWFFINHVTQSTTWEDPRPGYYSTGGAESLQKHTSGRRRKDTGSECVSSTSPSASESLYSDVDYTRTFSSRSRPESLREYDAEHKEDEEPVTTDFSAYLHALRAANPELDDRQLARLLEDYLGDSPELRMFISQYLRKNSSGGSSEGTKTRKHHSYSEQMKTANFGSGRKKPPNRLLKPVSEAESSSASSSVPQEKRSEQRSSVGSSIPQKTDSAPAEPGSSPLEPPEPERREQSSASTEPHEPAINLDFGSLSSEVLAQEPEPAPSSSSRGLAPRVLPRGPDPTIRVIRVRPVGANPNLAKGPNKQLVTGSAFARNLIGRER